MLVTKAENITRQWVDLPLEGKNILVVDDNKLILRSLSGILEERMKGYAILVAENGREAVDILDSCPVVLVLTDLNMPEMDGYQLLAYIREKYPSIPVLVMTADYSPGVETRLRSLGAVHCIEKPFEYEDLLDKISNKLAAPPGSGYNFLEKQYSV